MKTYSTKASDIKREWHVVDVADKVLGKVATQVAGLLMGKHKAMFNRHLDVGDPGWFKIPICVDVFYVVVPFVGSGNEIRQNRGWHNLA